MDLDNISVKRNNELEQQITQLLKTLRSAKLHRHPLYPMLHEFEQELGDARRKRYDGNDSEYGNY